MNSLLDIKSFLKFLRKNKWYTMIDVFGFSVSLMFVILIAVYTTSELSVDRQHVHRDDICVLTTDIGALSALPIAYRIKERYPQVVQACPVIVNNIPYMVLTKGDDKFNGRSILVDSCFFSFFSFELLSGEPSKVLESTDNVVISETFARKLFGNDNPVGQTFSIHADHYTVSGVMADIENSVIPYCDIIMRVDNAHKYNSYISLDNDSNAGSTAAFLRLEPGTSLDDYVDDLTQYFKQTYWPYVRGMFTKVGIVRLNDLYFSSYGAGLNTGDKGFVLILLSVGLLILFFAIFNYINLTVAQSGERAKEMATRRLLGSSRGDLFMRLMGETVTLTVISFLVGWLLAYLAVPFADDLLDTHLKLTAILSPVWLIGSALLILMIGVVSGLLPALLISSVTPIDVVRGTFRRNTKMVFSKVFIIIQNAITIALVSTSMVMALQTHHLIKAPLGYRTSGIVEIGVTMPNWATLVDNLKGQSFVKRVGLTQGMPLTGNNNLSSYYQGKFLSINEIVADTTTFSIMGYRVLRDNHLADKSLCYPTESAMEAMELPLDASYFSAGDNDAVSIAGVVGNFRHGNVTGNYVPTMVRVAPEIKYPWSIVVELQGDIDAAYEQILRLCNDHCGNIMFSARLLDDQVRDSFKAELRTTKIVVIFGCIALMISMLGLLAISTYFIRQRAQEVAIRKIFGSDSRGVMLRLLGAFVGYVGIAFVVATPVAWYLMSRWLSDYSYRIWLNPLIFIAAGLFCLVVSVVVVFLQSYKAANANPVESISHNK
ncbi:MAG: ABC transporter permease [Rikenellaceae bacterium]|nr:ABC transporter permease [Rikenellaceae bacterium]